VGIDPAKAMLIEARRLSTDLDGRVHYIASRAEATGLASCGFDLVTAGQCWHWFHRSVAAAEAARILAAGGRLVIGHFDWIPLAGNVVEATEKLIEKHNPDWKLGGGNGLYPMWLRGLSELGYREIRTWSYDVAVPYTPEDWRGRIRASAGIGASLSQRDVEAFDREHAAMLAERFPGDVIRAHHRVFTLVAHAPGRD
jgi:SAM-dependent methyltransferase